MTPIERPATPADIQHLHVLLLGRESRRPETIQRHTGRPLHLVIQAVARAAEFSGRTVAALIAGDPLPHPGQTPDAALLAFTAALLDQDELPPAPWPLFLGWALSAPPILRAIDPSAPAAATSLRTFAEARAPFEPFPPHGIRAAPSPAAPRITRTNAPAGPTRTSVIAWDLAHNPTARAHMLAELAGPGAELIGPIFADHGGRLWPPLADTPIPTRSFPAHDLKSLVEGALALARETTCDLVIVGKPRLPSLLIGALIRHATGCPLLLDIDDHELAFAQDPTPIGFAALEQAAAEDPAGFASPRSDLWTRFCAALIPEVDAITTVSGPLQREHGGILLRHARDEALFDPALQPRDATRRRLGYSPADRVLLFLGTPRAHKGLLTLLDALERVADPRLALCVMGTIRDMALLARLRAAAPHRVSLHPDQPWSRLPELTAMADAVALLQDPESPIADYQIPAKLTDALALGVPVIATRVPPIAELATDGTITLIDTPASLDAALRALATSRPRDANNSPRALFHQEFSFAINRPRLAAAQAEARRKRRDHTPRFERLFRLLETHTGIPLPKLTTPTSDPATTTPADRARAALEKARAAEARRDFPAAAALLDAALRESPRHADMLSIRARLALTLGDTPTAERHARAALALRPGLPRASILLARISMAAGRHEEAIAFWEAVPPADSAYRERLLKRGRSLLALARPLDALREFLQAIARDPKDRDALRAAAEATEATGALRTALHRWQAYIAVAPDDAEAAAAQARLAQRLAPPPGLASPLQNPNLRDWPRALIAEAGLDPIAPTPGLTLRALGDVARLHFAPAEACERRPGELPSYGLWLRAEVGGAELAFALTPAPALRMALETQCLEGPPEDALTLTLSLANRTLRSFRIGSRRRLTAFSLPADATGPLLLRIEGPATLLLRPPRPLSVIAPAPEPPTGFESAHLARIFRREPPDDPPPLLGRDDPAWLEAVS